jgi:hypothetical protein
MKTYGEVYVEFYALLTSTLDSGGQLHAPDALPSYEKRRYPYPLERRLGGPEVSLHAAEKRKTSVPNWNRPPIPRFIHLSHFTD